jgi:hypothetical protein
MSYLPTLSRSFRGVFKTPYWLDLEPALLTTESEGFAIYRDVREFATNSAAIACANGVLHLGVQ